MTHLEDELTAALQESGRAAPEVPDLATAARARRRDRTRDRFAAVSAAAAVVLVAGIAVAVPHLGDDPGAPAPTGRTPDSFAGTEWIPDGWRSETVGDLEMAVPADWRYGTISQFCVAGGDPTAPIFERPGSGSTNVACAANGGYGVRFHARSEDQAQHVPQGAAVRTAAVGDLTVVITLRSAVLADEVATTVHRVHGFDSNGCAPREEVPKLGVATTVGATTGAISVCRYNLDGRQGLLAQSERLDQGDADLLRAAISDAAPGRGPDAPASQCLPEPERAVVLLSTETGPLGWVHYDGCVGHAVDLGGSTRKVTPEVLYWVMTPGWSGGVTGVRIDKVRALKKAG